MTKINKGEYEILKALDDYWKWIARDENGRLWGYNKKPFNNGDEWLELNATELETYLFQFIQWEDEEPYNIAELIEEYEAPKNKSRGILIRDVLDIDNLDFTEEIKELNKMYKESEETEVKGKQWLKSNVARELDLLFHRHGLNNADFQERRTNILKLIDQLDEPETLSQEWLVEHSYNVHLLGTPDVETVAIPRDDLQNLLVPKQEITEEQALEVLSEIYDIPNKRYLRESMRVVSDYVGDESTLGELKEQLTKPTIPKFVADWIEKYRDSWELYVSMEEAMNYKRFDGRTRESDTQSEEMQHWLLDADNQELYVRAWLDGYEVAEEREQKYYVLDKEDATLLKKSTTNVGVAKSVGRNIYDVKKWKYEEKYQLTEQEIKDYDPRYWAFRKPVEELEE